VTAREQLVKQAIYNVVKDIDAVNRIYPIVFAHKEY
jgi:type I restriction enzyme R subunit